MFRKNSTQRNYKKQIKEIKKESFKKTNDYNNVFSNNLYKIKFWGYYDSQRRAKMKEMLSAIWSGALRAIIISLGIPGAILLLIWVLNFFTR